MATAPIDTGTTAVEAPVANDATAVVAPITAQDMYPDDPIKPKGGDLDDVAQGAEEQRQVDEGDGEINPDVNDEIPAIDPPKSWPDEDKEAFKALTALGPEGVKAAEVIAKRENERDAFVAQKGREVAQVRQVVETEARTAIAQTHEAFAQQLEQYAAIILPPQPDKRLLYTGNPQDTVLFNQLQVEYQDAVSQHQQMQSQAQQARQQASQIEEYHQQLARQAVAAEIEEKLGTEWTEPSARQKLQETLYPIGKELGYSDDAMRDANASDLLALKMAHSWKAKAEKYDALQKAKMEPVRAAKQLPKVTQPGSAGGGGRAVPQDTAAILYPNDVRR